MRESGGEAFRGTETGRDAWRQREKEKGGRTAGSELCREGGEDRKQKAEARRRGGEDGEPGVMASETQLQEMSSRQWSGPIPDRRGLQSWRGKCREGMRELRPAPAGPDSGLIPQSPPPANCIALGKEGAAPWVSRIRGVGTCWNPAAVRAPLPLHVDTDGPDVPQGLTPSPAPSPGLLGVAVVGLPAPEPEG